MFFGCRSKNERSSTRIVPAVILSVRSPFFLSIFSSVFFNRFRITLQQTSSFSLRKPSSCKLVYFGALVPLLWLVSALVSDSESTLASSSFMVSTLPFAPFSGDFSADRWVIDFFFIYWRFLLGERFWWFGVNSLDAFVATFAFGYGLGVVPFSLKSLNFLT